MLLDYASDKIKARRVAIGEACTSRRLPVPAFSLTTVETVKRSPSVSDILTAVFGQHGAHTATGEFVPGDVTREDVETFLRRSLQSWAGDSEDYILGEEAVSDGQH